MFKFNKYLRNAIQKNIWIKKIFFSVYFIIYIYIIYILYVLKIYIYSGKISLNLSERLKIFARLTLHSLYQFFCLRFSFQTKITRRFNR